MLLSLIRSRTSCHFTQVLLALVAVAAAESFYPGFNHFGTLGRPFIPGYQPWASTYGAFPRTGLIGNPAVAPFYGTHGRIFKREAESKSFYPGFPFAPMASPYGLPGFYPHQQMYNPMVGRPFVNPVVNPYMARPIVGTYASHPFMYNPLLKVEEKEVEEVSSVEDAHDQRPY